MGVSGGSYLKKRIILMFLLFAVVWSATTVATAIPYSPQNAVRLYVLKNGHPIASMFAFPKVMSRADSKLQSGNNKLTCYGVNINFSAGPAGVPIYAVRVKRVGLHKYQAYPAYPLG